MGESSPDSAVGELAGRIGAICSEPQDVVSETATNARDSGVGESMGGSSPDSAAGDFSGRVGAICSEP